MTVYIFDCETTSLDDPEIIEAAWLELAVGVDLLGPNPDVIPAGLCVERFHQMFYRPSKPITFGSMAVHHILPFELEGEPPSSQFKLPEDCEYIVGHSIDYDWRAAGSPPNVRRICTHAMAQHIWPDADGYSQSALLYMLLGPTVTTRALLKGAHSALADVKLNGALLAEILYRKPEIKTWSKLWEFSEEARIPLTCPMKKYEGTPLAELDRGFVFWCLGQPWFEEQYPYFKKGLLRVIEADRKAQLAAAPGEIVHPGGREEREEGDIPWRGVGI